MRKLSSVALATSLLALGACDDSTSAGDIFRREGTLDGDGFVSVLLPREAGRPDRLPALSCYTANPVDRVWFLVSSVELPHGPGPGDNEVLSNCILEPDEDDANRLRATIEGETPGWLYHIVVVY